MTPAALLLLLAPLAHLANGKPYTRWNPKDVPAQAQVLDPKSWNYLENIAPQDQFDGGSLFFPPGTDLASLKAKPFHIYDDAFYRIIGDEPTLTLIARTDKDPLFHEAVVWHPPTNDVFFVQNAGAKDAGTGLAKSAIVQKISLDQAIAVKHKANATGEVEVVTLGESPQVINPNGGTNWRGKVIFAGEGMGVDVPSSLFLMEPTAPYNTTVLLNNFFGRQFNSLNDVAVHPTNKWIYMTDVDYGVLQEFRGKNNIRRQVYRFNPDSGVVEAVADANLRPNGLTFSPDGKWLYVTDTGAAHGFAGTDWEDPAGIYRFPVDKNGRVGAQELFAYTHVGFPDGVHCDEKGNVYSGVGDGIHVWNPQGTLLGKIYVGGTSANFAFTGKGMVICAETELYYATFAAKGMDITGL